MGQRTQRAGSFRAFEKIPNNVCQQEYKVCRFIYIYIYIYTYIFFIIYKTNFNTKTEIVHVYAGTPTARQLQYTKTEGPYQDGLRTSL